MKQRKIQGYKKDTTKNQFVTKTASGYKNGFRLQKQICNLAPHLGTASYSVTKNKAQNVTLSYTEVTFSPQKRNEN
jgi:hypothetical protein